MEAYTQALAYELAPFGIEVSVVEPGPFGTGLLYSGPKEADQLVLNAYGAHKDLGQGQFADGASAAVGITEQRPGGQRGKNASRSLQR